MTVPENPREEVSEVVAPTSQSGEHEAHVAVAPDERSGADARTTKRAKASNASKATVPATQLPTFMKIGLFPKRTTSDREASGAPVNAPAPAVWNIEHTDAGALKVDTVFDLSDAYDFPWDKSPDGKPRVLHGRLASDLANDPEINRPLVEIIPWLSVACRLTLVVAREKLGKTTLLAFCATEISRGDHLGVAGRVLWCGLEEPVGDSPPDRVIETIREEIKAFRPTLVVIDSLAVLGSYLNLQERSEEGWTRLFEQLRRAAQDYGCGMVVLHHARKSDNDFRGSTAIAAAADQIITMHDYEKTPNTRRMHPRGRWRIEKYLITCVFRSCRSLISDQSDH